MDLLITHESALEFWRLHRRSQLKHEYRRSRKKPPCESPDSYTLRHGETRGLTLPLDIMVDARNTRRPSKAVVPHVCSKPLLDGAFVDAGSGLYVSSPEFCFFQLADEYPLAKLIAVGIELCGSYSLPGKTTAGTDHGAFAGKDHDVSTGTNHGAFAGKEQGVSTGTDHGVYVSKKYDASDQALYNLPQLTSRKKLKDFVTRMGGWSGYKRAIKALRYIADDSASPMETILFILLTLPYRYGGYGLPMPELNGRIYPGKGVKRFSGRDFYRGDLLWRKAGIVAEYNSDLEHTGSERIARDAIRQSDLNLCGIYEIPVTKEQIKKEELLDKVARQIAARIGRQLRYKDPGFSEARKELRSVLL